MLIGIDASRTITRQRTGTEAYATFLLQALIPVATAQNHQIRLYFNKPSPAKLFPQSPQVEHVIIPFPRLWTHLRLAAELHRRPPDVFFTPAHVIPVSYFGSSVATIHDLGYHHFPEAHPWRQLAYLRWSTRHNGRRARRVIADSQATKQDLIQLDGIPAHKIDVIYPGVDPALQPVTDEAVLTAVHQKHNITPPYLLYLSTLQPRKNLVRLIQAYGASNLPHQLVLAGKPGWLSQPILEVIGNQSSVIRERIVVTGFVDEVDKAALLTGATAVLYPSLYEGFGFPVLEAQACGTAVLTATTSSLPEVAGDAALLVNPLDTMAITQGMQRLVQDKAYRQTLVQRGFENVKRFRWEETAVQLLHTLEENHHE
ncbi:glycosyltransferase family 4 protein [Candidatus Leptofilum sp.]|uniref:glycosyltransferase family 4 protein n=1 Tax=Candidatus Leptofilum sp. TaxID=3241576 RepID=UPI003B58C3BC